MYGLGSLGPHIFCEPHLARLQLLLRSKTPDSRELAMLLGSVTGPIACKKVTR